MIKGPAVRPVYQAGRTILATELCTCSPRSKTGVRHRHNIDNVAMVYIFFLISNKA